MQPLWCCDFFWFPSSCVCPIFLSVFHLLLREKSEVPSFSGKPDKHGQSIQCTLQCVKSKVTERLPEVLRMTWEIHFTKSEINIYGERRLTHSRPFRPGLTWNEELLLSSLEEQKSLPSFPKSGTTRNVFINTIAAHLGPGIRSILSRWLKANYNWSTVTERIIDCECADERAQTPTQSPGTPQHTIQTLNERNQIEMIVFNCYDS